MDSGGTPVCSAAMRGLYGLTDSATSWNPLVCAAMKSRSSRPSRRMTCSMLISSTRSVPGRNGRYRSALREIGVMRGSATISLRAMVAGAPDVIGGDGRAFAHVGADHEDHVRLRNVAPGNRAAVHIERQLVGGARGDHAEAAVVIDVPRAQSHTRELAQQIRLLGNQRSAAENRDGVLAILGLNLAQPPDGEIERFIPGAGPKTDVGAHQRIEQPVGMIGLQVALHAFRAEHAAIERELFPRLEPDHLVVANLQLNAALLAAEAAVGLDQTLRRIPRFVLPAAGRKIIWMRSVLFA